MFTAYADVPGYPLVFPLVYGAMAYFALAMARHLRVFSAATPSRPFASVPRRAAGVVVYALAQARMFRDARAGLMHVAIFWGFVALTVGTADIVTGGLVRAIVGWPLDGALWTFLTAIQNVAAVGVLLAVGYAAWRRLVSRPRRLALTRGALVILGLIGGLVTAELLAMALEAARSGDRPGAIVANALAVPLRGVDPGLLAAGFAACWWTHVLLVAAFLCYLPGSKHLHMVTSFFNIYFRKLAPRGELPAMDLEADNRTFGVRTIADLGWKDLLDGFTCTECGRCTEACPANATGKSLDPRAMIMGIRHLAVDAERGLNLVPNSPVVRETFGLDDRLAPAALATPIVDAAIPYEAVWDCVTCGACVEACPVLIEHVDKIVGLRRNLVLEESRFPAELTGGVSQHGAVGQSVGQPTGGPGRLDEGPAVPGADRGGPGPGRHARHARGALLGRLRGRVRRAQPEGRPGRGHLPPRRRRSLRDPGPGGILHGGSGAPDGQRVRLPAARDGQRRDAAAIRHGEAHDHHRLPALLQHDRHGVRAAGRDVRDRSPLGLPAGPPRLRAAAPRRGQAAGPRVPSRFTTAATWRATTGSPPSRARSCASCP